MPVVLLLATCDEDARVIFTTYLSHRGYTVRSASSGDEAVQLCLDGAVRLVIFDAPMALASGESLGRALRRLEQTRGLPILGVSAWLDSFMSGEDGGVATEHLLKPLPLAELGSAVERLIARGRASAEAPPAA
jgi:DNA-binding response OmpR family regulator